MPVRNLTRILLAVQAALAALIGWCWWRWGGAGPWMALLGGIATVTGLRLLINLNNFAMAAFFASPTPASFRLAPGARLHLVAEEFWTSMLTTSWRMPRGRPAMRIHPASTHVPVLLLHGYGCNSGYWARLVPMLDAARISHASIDLAPLGGDIDAYAASVERAVEDLCAASGAPRVAIVGHSMGGLVARAWMRAHGSSRVARVITLGTPHHGSALARFGPGTNAVQMRRSGRGTDELGNAASPWLHALAAAETPATRALVTSLYSHHDNIVSPQTTSVLAGARNIAFGGVGHVALGSNPRVQAAILRELPVRASQPV